MVGACAAFNELDIVLTVNILSQWAVLYGGVDIVLLIIALLVGEV